ncbi:MAG: aminotransferase class I/II-fold pyridoxal phosphate-dependent enzyme [Verrucomicrobia bacterium]|nr:aminotransferase class I/II-fold pyridoxal phosphate-dependent enzyme [Verrucomicrobiota bacterium]
MEFVLEAFQSNWVAPAGPNLDAFEEDFAQLVGSKHAVAVSSGTAALHLALRLAGVGPGDEVLCSSLTFVASAAPITYLGAKPVFIDSEERSWNMDPALACAVIEQKAKAGKAPKALVLVHLYCLTIDPQVAGVTREQVRLALEAENIEARPVWKPMHLQPVFAGAEMHGGQVSARLFDQGLCLPSGAALSDEDRARVITSVSRVFVR